MWWKLKNFSEDIQKIEGLLFELAAHNDELKFYGLRYVLRRIDFENILTILDNFSSNLAGCLRATPLINSQTGTRLNALLTETNIEDLVIQLTVRLKIAKKERAVAQGIAAYSYMIRRVFVKSEQISLFTDNSIPLESVLAAFSRLRIIIKSLEEEQFRKTQNDDEIFKPSNIDVSLIASQIEEAIEHINTSNDIAAPEKERLVSYLSEAKSELAEKAPAWKKVVGALIICATLLSGVAAAPQAIDNLNDAIKHILGASIEKNIPNLLPEATASPVKDNSKKPEKQIHNKKMHPTGSHERSFEI